MLYMALGGVPYVKTNTLLAGPIGSGKTWCLRTLLREYPDAHGRSAPGAGKTVCLFALEPGWAETNGDLSCEMGFHVHEHLPVSEDLDSSIAWFELVKNMSVEGMHKLTVPPNIKNKYNAKWIDLYRISGGYTCDRCGKDFGPADSWSDDTAFVQDGLTGLSTIAKHFTVGPKPHMSWPEFEAAQSYIKEYLSKCISIKASFVLIAHQSREPSEEKGGTVITVDTIGNKLAPQLARMFSEIVLTVRVANTYKWSTEMPGMELKTRRLPYSDAIAPTFVQLLK